jgi:hypothetical protein
MMIKLENNENHQIHTYGLMSWGNYGSQLNIGMPK